MNKQPDEKWNVHDNAGPSRFPGYPEYRDTGIEWLGVAPVHWSLTAFKHMATLNPSKSGFTGDKAQSCSFVPMDKLKTGSVTLDEERIINDVFGGYTYFENGDVLQAKVTPCFENKNVALARYLVNGVGFGSSEINVLRPKRETDPAYLLYRVQDSGYMAVCTASMIGAGGLKRVPSSVINNFKVVIPPLGEQTQIARFLDHETAKIDALIREQERLIELLQEKRQAVISHAVTKGLDPNVPMKDSGVEWLGEVPAHWEVTRMRFLCHITTGDRDTQDAKVDGQYPFIVRSDTIEKSDTYSFDGEGVFTSGDGAGVGKIFHYFSGKCAIHQRVYLFHNFYKITGKFFYHFLRSKLEHVVLSQSAKSTVDSLRLPMLQNFWMTRPPYVEQELICDYINSFECQNLRLMGKCSTSIQLLKERRSALIPQCQDECRTL